MRAKYLIIIAGIGVVFVGVSLWVFLSRGRSAKAISAKYKLGGALLTFWAMFSAATCGPKNKGIAEPLCYDMPCPVNEVSIFGKEDGNSFSDGDVLTVTILYPVASKYIWNITGEDGSHIIQEGEFSQPAEDTSHELDSEITIATGGYSGNAVFTLEASYTEEDGSVRTEKIATQDILLRPHTS